MSGPYTVKVEKAGVQIGPTYRMEAADAVEALFTAHSLAECSPSEAVNAPTKEGVRVERRQSGTRVEHFEAQGWNAGVGIAQAVEEFLALPGFKREFVSLTHARTDPPNNVTAAFLVYREREA